MIALSDIIQGQPDEYLYYDNNIKAGEISFDLKQEFVSIAELDSVNEKREVLCACLEIGLSPDLDSVRIFIITNELGETCKLAVWCK